MTNDEELLSAILAEIDNAEFTSIDDLETAMQYYNADTRGDEIKGRSDVQSHDVADMIEALAAQIMPAFDSKQLASFEPLSADDEERVRVEARFINHIVMDNNNGFITIQEGLKNALLMRDCIFKVFVESKVSVQHIGIADDFSDIDFMTIKARLEANQELFVEDKEDVVEGDWRVGIITTSKSLKIESVPPEEFLYIKGWHKQSLTECPFVAQRRELKRYELIDMGHDPDDVADLSMSTSTGVSRVDIRDDYDSQDHSPSNSMLDTIEYYEAYYVYDYDDDGYPELLKVCIASDKLMAVEQVDFHPFAGGSTVLLPNRFKGISTYDQQKDVQDGKTKILRQYTDNINANNNRRLEAEIKQIIDINDLTDSKPGGVIKVRRLGSVAPIPVDDIGPSCERFLSYWDRIRTNRSGASLDMASENMPVGGETAHGAERIISSKEQIGNLAANTFKETAIKDMFLLVHKTMRSYMEGNQTAKINGEWVDTNPELWGDRSSVNITIGASQGIANKQVMAYENLIGKQIQAFSNNQGGVLVNHMGVYDALIDLGRASGINNPEKYWQRPDSKESQQTLKSAQESGQKQRDIQEKLQSAMVRNESIRAQADAKSKQARSIIDDLKFKLDGLKASAKDSNDAIDKDIDLIKHYDNLAMQLTSLEAQYSGQIDDYQENKDEVDGQ